MTQGYPNLCNPKCVWVAEGGRRGGEEREQGSSFQSSGSIYAPSTCRAEPLPRPRAATTSQPSDQPASQPACLLPAPVPSTIHHSASSSLRRAKDGAEEREEKSPISVEWFSPHRVPEFPPVCFPEKATGLGDVTLQGESVTLL